MTEQLLHLIIGLAVLVCAWFILARFSPDPTITKVCQVIIFVLALILVVRVLLPLVGV